ncbi:MAG: hypothetical protein CVV32_04015 [Methanomicrobiales archaeon HGW-Methanomicrobiales-3]|jgi:hypothetical protein|nr:MAG: hypothetical protein CVV32_04015 [Methanomicrobiales archaeon HGW-Methanomicrobiales-3]
MAKPEKTPELKRTCPACNSPVRTGFKFCEFCGTRIPELSTCTHCGTQFITPRKFCDLCGAKVVLEVQPPPYEETDDLQPAVDVDTEDSGACDEDYGTYDEEIPEQDEFQEDYPEEFAGQEEDEPPLDKAGGIAEPDTDELLEKFGKEYRDDETLEAPRRFGFSFFSRAGRGSQAPAPARSPVPSSDGVDDALFLAKKKERPANPRVNLTFVIGGVLVLAILIAAGYFIVLPLLAEPSDPGVHSSVTVADITDLPEATAVTKIPYGSSGSGSSSANPLVPRPTETIPSGQTLYFHVDKDPVTAKITVIFAGSAGVGSISSAEVKVTHPNGAVATGIILPLKGVSEITLDGSKETDRLEIIATMTTGETYRVRDELLPLWKQ